MNCEIDTGAAISVLPTWLFEKYFKHFKLTETNVKVRSVTGKDLPIKGKVCISYIDKNFHFFVADTTLKGPLLSRDIWIQCFQNGEKNS